MTFGVHLLILLKEKNAHTEGVLFLRLNSEFSKFFLVRACEKLYMSEIKNGKR